MPADLILDAEENLRNMTKRAEHILGNLKGALDTSASVKGLAAGSKDRETSHLCDRNLIVQTSSDATQRTPG